MTTQSPTQRTHASPSIEEALAALAHLEDSLPEWRDLECPDDREVLSIEKKDLAVIRSALTSAAQEQVAALSEAERAVVEAALAWRELSAFEYRTPDHAIELIDALESKVDALLALRAAGGMAPHG